MKNKFKIVIVLFVIVICAVAGLWSFYVYFSPSDDSNDTNNGPSNYPDPFFNFVVWSYNNTTIINVYPFSSRWIHETQWEEFELIINDIIHPHGRTGNITIDDDIDITDIVGTDDYNVYFRHIPTDTIYEEFSPNP